ncbi:hypothetical protein F511_19218 [Dorcoceras hygrometricum]|uniref:Uncharacterized protein n=1 Tax=Dorcoceras hygrometricum TaxID=472368 RepID=A0A2Z7A9G7_9LAMI|nr:hypothetical protein F511_19218 [Dorcoceras hygrometricum]
MLIVTLVAATGSEGDVSHMSSLGYLARPAVGSKADVILTSSELFRVSAVDFYSLEAVERLEEESVKLLVYEDFWRNLIERSLIVVRFWIPGTDFSSRESLPCLPSQEGSGCLGRELQRLVRTLLRCVVPEKSNAMIGVVTTGFECLPPSCVGLMGSEDHGPMIFP